MRRIRFLCTICIFMMLFCSCSINNRYSFVPDNAVSFSSVDALEDYVGFEVIIPEIMDYEIAGYYALSKSIAEIEFRSLNDDIIVLIYSNDDHYSPEESFFKEYLQLDLSQTNSFVYHLQYYDIDLSGPLDKLDAFYFARWGNYGKDYYLLSSKPFISSENDGLDAIIEIIRQIGTDHPYFH